MLTGKYALLFCLAGATLLSTAAQAQNQNQPQSCSIPAATVQAIQSKLATVVKGLSGDPSGHPNGGLFNPNLMWSAIVDRNDILCSVIKTGDAWPGSRAIAIAKAGTANDFSNSNLALSTANLYAPTQPGGSLYGLNNSNPFNAFYNPITTGSGPGTGVGQNAGGIITFGGGVALYQGKQVIGGLGVSGDTSCADHAIAYRMRHLAGLDGIPGGVAPDGTDNIIYAPSGQAPTGFQQPHCSATDITP
jgi:uncharacterized protein GlcG (DUF336 family)